MTGALQDHDRGLVVGETTWGKALVQSIYRLSEGAGLALTTAHYFTPAGRLIQRPWDESFDEYLSYTTRDQEANVEHTPSQLKYTLRLGRKVYSGGGIEPDHRMAGPIEGFNPGKFARRLYPTMFGNYAQRFDREGDDRFGSATDQKARRTLTREFTVDDAMLQDFKAFVKSQLRDQSQFDEAGFNADVEFIRAMLRYEIDVALFDVATARRHLLEKDPQAQYALTLFPEAEKLLRATPVEEHPGRRESRVRLVVSGYTLGRTSLLLVGFEFVLAPIFGACYTDGRSGSTGPLRFRGGRPDSVALHTSHVKVRRASQPLVAFRHGRYRAAFRLYTEKGAVRCSERERSTVNHMRLQQLEIAGFKSFSDRSHLSFDRGVTAIVGPNGCGKSNVADAITWVLGEQSAKSLRGDRMEDVIFNGSDARKPTGAAEVRLRLSDVLSTPIAESPLLVSA